MEMNGWKRWNFAERCGLQFIHCDQKVLGHIRKNLPRCWQIWSQSGSFRGADPQRQIHLALRHLAEWAPVLQILLRREALHLHRRHEMRRAAREEDMKRNASSRSSWTLRTDRHPKGLMALSTKEQIELADWQYHINNGHVPFRRDCCQCQESQGTSEETYLRHLRLGLIREQDDISTSWQLRLGSFTRLYPIRWGLATLRRRQCRALRDGAR